MTGVAACVWSWLVLTSMASLPVGIVHPAADGPAALAAAARDGCTDCEAVVESFRRDPRFAAAYLNAALADGDQSELMVALRYMASAFGGVPQLATHARLNATTLYRTLSPNGNPELRSLTALLEAMGMRLAVQPIPRDLR